eukprot:1300241-Prymnesium_polylepis.1
MKDDGPQACSHASVNVQASCAARPRGTGAPPIPQRRSPNCRANRSICSCSPPPLAQASQYRPAPLHRTRPPAPSRLPAGVWTAPKTRPARFANRRARF